MSKDVTVRENTHIRKQTQECSLLALIITKITTTLIKVNCVHIMDHIQRKPVTQLQRVVWQLVNVIRQATNIKYQIISQNSVYYYIGVTTNSFDVDNFRTSFQHKPRERGKSILKNTLERQLSLKIDLTKAIK